MCLFTLASLCLGLAPSAGTLIFFRAFHGIGAAMVFGTAVAITTSTFPSGERGRALGIQYRRGLSRRLVRAFLRGHPYPAYRVEERLSFQRTLRPPRDHSEHLEIGGKPAPARGESFDLAGPLSMLTLLVMMYGLSLLPSHGGFAFILLGVAGIAGFVARELRAESPILDIRLLMTNKVFTLSNAAALTNYSATFAVSFLLSLYLQYIKGMSPQNAGIVLVSQPLVQAVFSPMAGRLSDKMEPRLLASVGMALTALGLLLLVLLGSDTSLSFIIASLVILGLGFGVFSSPNTNAIMSSVEDRFYGVASSMLATMRLIGQMLSMGIVMVVFAVFIGRVAITPPLHGLLVKSIQIIFAVSPCYVLRVSSRPSPGASSAAPLDSYRVAFVWPSRRRRGRRRHAPSYVNESDQFLPERAS